MCELSPQGLLICMMRQGKFTSAHVHVNGLQTRRYACACTCVCACMGGNGYLTEANLSG